MKKATPYQQALVSRLLTDNSTKASIIKRQLSTGFGTEEIDYGDNYGSFEIHLPPGVERVPIEDGVAFIGIGHEQDNKAITISLLLHVYDGYASELEIVRDDGYDMENLVDIQSIKLE